MMQSVRRITWFTNTARADARLPAKQVAAVAAVAAVFGGCAALVIVLLAEVRRYYGGYWLPVTAAGTAAAVAVPVLLWWLLHRTYRNWAGWLVLGYCVLVNAGVFYFARISMRGPAALPPVPPVLPPPSPVALLELGALALAAASITMPALLFLMLLLLVSVGQVRRRRRRRAGQDRARRRRPGPPPIRDESRIPVRLRAQDAGGRRKWRHGTLRLAPGSLRWEPAGGTGAAPVELAVATVVPAPRQDDGGPARPAQFIQVDTAAGRVDLRLSAGRFAQLQAQAAQATVADTGGETTPGVS